MDKDVYCTFLLFNFLKNINKYNQNGGNEHFRDFVMTNMFILQIVQIFKKYLTII